MKKILILGAAKNQLPLICTAKELGYYTIVCDWTTTNPGIAMADKHYQVSIIDSDICLEVARKECIDGVISNYEAAMPTVAYISECLGLIGNSSEGIKVLSTKSIFRDFQRKCGLYAPDCISGSEYAVVSDSLKSFSFPVIVKPCECSATRGTTRIDTFDEDTLKRAFDDCVSLSRNKKACVEEFVEMPSLEVIDGDVFVYNGNYLWGGYLLLSERVMLQ